MRRLAVIPLSFLLAGTAACQTFDPPPRPSIDNEINGVMSSDPADPLTLRFDEPYVGRTLNLKVVHAVFDAEGNLQDEQSPPDPEGFKANTVIAYSGADPENEDVSYGAAFTASDTTLEMAQNDTFSVSAPYLVLIEPGLEDEAGHATVPRTRLPFTYQLTGGGPTALPTGYYYFVMNVDFAAVQIQAFAYFEIDPDTGIWRGIFTNANRLDALNKRDGCPSDCSGQQMICQLVPSAKCVNSSEKQTDLLQFVDFLPEEAPPFGYTFIADGFARDEANGTTAFGTAPFVIDMTIGTGGGVHVQTENTRVTGVFRKHDDDRWRCTGSISVDVVKPVPETTKGTFEAMNLTAEEVKQVESYGFAIPTNLH
jgi:hypothetical protein